MGCCCCCKKHPKDVPDDKPKDPEPPDKPDVEPVVPPAPEPAPEPVLPPPPEPPRPPPRPTFRIGLGAEFPDFECNTTEGKLRFHAFLDGQHDVQHQRPGKYSWTMLFSHPKDFTPVCTTEIATCQMLLREFQRRGVRLIGLSCDSVANHKAWVKDVLAWRMDRKDLKKVEARDTKLGFPLIADEDRSISEMLGMLDPAEVSATDKLPMPARALFLIGPEKRNRLTILYPATTGRNFAEVLRVIDSLYLTGHLDVGTPAFWHPGDHVVPNLHISSLAASDLGQATQKPLPSGKTYMRHVAHPELKHDREIRAMQEVKPGESSFRIKLGATFPDFDCTSTFKGINRFHKLLAHQKTQWTLLIVWPADFSPVATTELMACRQILNDLRQRSVSLLGMSCDSLENHAVWAKDAMDILGDKNDDLGFPLIADLSQYIAKELGLLGPGSVPHKDRSPARGLFVLDSTKSLRLSLLYPETTGFNFFEILRAIDSLILTQNHQLATPANWQSGDPVIVDPSVPTELAKQRFAGFRTETLPSNKLYMRFADDPGQAPLPSLPPAASLSGPEWEPLEMPPPINIRTGPSRVEGDEPKFFCTC
eukprot:TRINITY_DN23793_c0_g2_i1.p1 TRINITY_DN23793_c0_g2~~TRINITY_DN23793_c0_g2_i1.p1  ORF type:complete len:593 (+),score=87.98 TRINITY_DN23793_c0_g2_i1:63-1841(+)